MTAGTVLIRLETYSVAALAEVGPFDYAQYGRALLTYSILARRG
jgi:hypothetical protein